MLCYEENWVVLYSMQLNVLVAMYVVGCKQATGKLMMGSIIKWRCHDDDNVLKLHLSF